MHCAKPPLQEDISQLRRRLLRWYRKHGRTYPWRESQSPFHVLLAEMMLQRTRADQVVPIYLEVVQRYPEPEDLAKARLSDLRRIMKPLGLLWRIPNFKAMAKILVEQFGGAVPNSREELTTLPGVGEYVAGAVLSVAFGKREWIVDANVVRLFRRYFGINTSAEGRRDAHVIELARGYAAARNPKSSTLAILDHSALVCVSGVPRCHSCPLSQSCVYFIKNLSVS